MDKFYLNEQEKHLLATFASNEVLMSAVKKVLLEPVYFDGVLVAGVKADDPVKNFALQKTARAIQTDPHITDEALGQQIRADVQGIRYVELGFQELAKFKREEREEKKEINEAR